MNASHLTIDELSDADDGAAAAHVAQCSDCARRVDALRSVRTAIAALDRTAPPPTAARELLRSARSPSPRWAVPAILGAALTLVAVVVVLSRSASAPFPSRLMDEIALDHLHYAHRADAVQVTGSAREIAVWFVPTLGRAPHLADLEATSMIGARNCRLDGQRVALVFVERAGHRLSLIAMPRTPPRARACGIAEGVRVCATPDPIGGARVLVGDLSDSEMLRLLDESLR